MQAPQKRSVKVFSSFVCLSYLYKIKKSGPELPESNPRFTQPGAYLLYMPPSQQTSDTQCHRPKRSVLRRACPKIENSPTGRRKAGLLARSCRNAFPALSDQWLSACRGNYRNLQQRELLPIFTAFPFNHTGPCPALCEPLRCKVRK